MAKYYVREISVDRRTYVMHSKKLVEYQVTAGGNPTHGLVNGTLGRYVFQKKDTLGNNVTSSYCSNYNWCAVDSADPVNNVFRVLMTEATKNSIPSYFNSGKIKKV